MLKRGSAPYRFRRGTGRRFAARHCRRESSADDRALPKAPGLGRWERAACPREHCESEPPERLSFSAFFHFRNFAIPIYMLHCENLSDYGFALSQSSSYRAMLTALA
jgi:hypothetical protein